MIRYITYYFRRREHRAHRKTSRKVSSDDGYGGHSDRTAKVNSYGVAFGCFLLVKTEYRCRSPPFQLEFIKILIERTKGNEKIRLKDECPWFSGDEYIEISDEIAEVFAEFAKSEQNYKRRKRYHRAFYSLNAGDDIEKEILFVAASPHEIYERKVTQVEVYAAINSLPEKQAKRIYAHSFH